MSGIYHMINATYWKQDLPFGALIGLPLQFLDDMMFEYKN